MCVLMTTVKMIKRFAESKMAKNKQFSKLSGPRMGVLFIVQESGKIRMGDLANKLMVAPRTVTDLVEGLERDGFIKRVADPQDKRAMLIELTATTKPNMVKISSLRKAFVEEIFSVLNNDEQCQLVALLSKIINGPLRNLTGKDSCDR